MSHARESLKQHTTPLYGLASRVSFLQLTTLPLWNKPSTSILKEWKGTFLACLKWKQQQTRIKLDFRVSKAYQPCAEDRLKISGIQSNYKADTDNWHFDSCWQPYFTWETLLLKQFNILYYGNLLHFWFFFSLCLQKETGMICLREAPKGTSLVISTWWAPVIAAMQRLYFYSPFFNSAEVLWSEKQIKTSFILNSQSQTSLLWWEQEDTLPSSKLNFYV